MKMDTDMELDAIGVILDEPVYCGNCITEMNSIGVDTFKCPKCGSIFRNM
jgi:tRNA(Ile2) C34 agmatinyltransferase TiaS